MSLKDLTLTLVLRKIGALIFILKYKVWAVLLI